SDGGATGGGSTATGGGAAGGGAGGGGGGANVGGGNGGGGDGGGDDGGGGNTGGGGERPDAGQPPRLTSTSVMPDGGVTVCEQFTLGVTFVDDDPGDTVTVAWSVRYA